MFRSDTEVPDPCCSYDAAEDNELSFKEGDRIVNIDKVDTDWWQGECNGRSGLFPAAYVVAPDA